MLKKSKVDCSRLMRTGGLAAVTYGQACTGVSPTMLHTLWVTVATMISSPSGKAGQNLDLASMLADTTATGQTDPPFVAHVIPLQTFAKAVFHQSAPLRMIASLVAQQPAKQLAAAAPWRHATGPVGAAIATAARIGWRIQDAITMITHDAPP